jgi:hypothetical protein
VPARAQNTLADPAPNDETSFTLEVIDAQAFRPVKLPGLLRNPTSDFGSEYLRTGVFADGASVLVIRAQPLNNIPYDLTFSVAYVPDPAVGTLFPQTTQYVGSVWPVPLPGTPYPFPFTLPAPDQGQGSTSQTVLAGSPKLVYYCPPNNFLFGRQGGQQLQVVVTGGGQQQTASLNLVRPSIFLIHGVTSKPEFMYDMGNALFARGVATTQNGRAIQVRYLDWSDISVAGYDVVPARLRPFPPAPKSANIQTELDSNRAQKIAATRLDFVGHSMGAVILKWYSLDISVANQPRRNQFPNINWNSPGFMYRNRRDKNFGVGDIRRLVSVGSPFQGSIIADHISNTLRHAKALVRLGQVLGAIPTDIDAVDDLGTQSQGTNILSHNPANVSWFPVVGYGTPLTEEALFKGKKLEYDLLRVLRKRPSDLKAPPPNYLQPENSDFVVDCWSQMDRLPLGVAPAKRGWVSDVTHLTEMEDGVHQAPMFPPLHVAHFIELALDLFFDNPQDNNYTPGYTNFNPSF